MYLHPSHQLKTSLWRWSHNFQLSSYNQFTAQQEKVARKQSPALSRICGHEMQIAAAVMFKLRSFEPACKWCSCSSLLHYRWIPCYVFGDTLVVNIMGVTAVTSLLLRWWWWGLLYSVASLLHEVPFQGRCPMLECWGFGNYISIWNIPDGRLGLCSDLSWYEADEVTEMYSSF